jgi:hypothetical protein
MFFGCGHIILGVQMLKQEWILDAGKTSGKTADILHSSYSLYTIY